MSNPTNSIRNELIRKIEAAYVDLESCLAGLSEAQMTGLHDDQGWNVKDHIAHLAAWEESIVMLFQGRPRYQTLGIEQAKFSSESINEINATIRDRRLPLAIGLAIEELRSIHARLMAAVSVLSDADLNKPAAKFFPQVPASDERRVIDIIHANSDYHFLEHLPWIKTLVTAKEKKATFTTTVLKDDHSDATGLQVPAEAVAALGSGKKPKVKVSLNGYTYRTTVAVMGGLFMLPLSAEHRQAAGVKGGDEVEVTLELDMEPRTVVVPADLAEALAKQGAAAAFEALSYTMRKEYVRQVESAKAQETRSRRIAGIVAKLS